MRVPKTSEERMRLVGLLIGAGLSVQLFTAFWTHPLSFIFFIAAAAPVAMGVLLFLYWMLRRL